MLPTNPVRFAEILAYTDVYAHLFWEENTIRSLKSTAEVSVSQNEQDRAGQVIMLHSFLN
jgi:hypothetical protein